MKELTFTAYPFDELSDRAKDTARNWYRGTVDMEDWADPVTEDAARVGVKIAGWDIGRGQSIDLEFEERAARVYELVMEHRGEGCDTRKAAMEYRSEVERAALATEWTEEEANDCMEKAVDAFRKNLGECYLKMLREEYDYAMSDEAIDEAIEANEYYFTEDGKRSVVLNDNEASNR